MNQALQFVLIKAVLVSLCSQDAVLCLADPAADQTIQLRRRRRVDEIGEVRIARAQASPGFVA